MTIDIQEDVLESLKSTLERADFKSATQIIIDNNSLLITIDGFIIH